MKMITKIMVGTLVLLVAGYSQMAAAARNPNPGVIPINSKAFGKSYGVWGQEFNSWLFQFSLDEYPLFQGNGPADCGNAQQGKVWFLYGTLGGEVTRSCTIPDDRALFISVNSVTSFVPFFGDNEQEVREDAKRDLDGTATTLGVVTLEVKIDGVPLNDPLSYRASSPDGGFTFTIQDGSILDDLGFPVGDYYPAIVDGYWIMLPPLSVGEHLIEWASSGQFQDGSLYDYRVSWNLQVVE